MTSRLTGWKDVEDDETIASASGEHGGLISPVTPSLIDEAVDIVQTRVKTDEGTAEALRETLKNDIGSDIAHSYYMAQAAKDRASLASVAQKELGINYPLNDEDVRALTAYAPEFKLNFRSTVLHDHPMAAASRVIDFAVITSRIPKGVPFSDIGGNPLLYINRGYRQWHVCGTEIDKKDAQRYKLRQLEAKRIVKREVDTTKAKSAQAYLNKDPAFVCDKLAQHCQHPTPVGICIHVYDIPIRDWPAIMEKKGMQIVEGCLLFSDRFFEEKQGELGVSKARYELDTAANIFRMGFADSPSWWYEHAWSEYMLYGADQILPGDSGYYSYKIVERRGDTIFFRILRCQWRPQDGLTPHVYVYPQVPIVVVNGYAYESDSSGARFVKKQFRFPRSIWADLVNQATEDYERGVLDFTKMYNHYRTMSVRQTVNSVLIMGDNKVPEALQVSLVVNACMAAAAASLLGQKTTRALTNAVLHTRALGQESTLTKFGDMTRKLLNSALGATTGVFTWPIDALERFFHAKHEEEMLQHLVDWAPEWEYRMVPAVQFFNIRMRGAASFSESKHPTDVLVAGDGVLEDDYQAIGGDEELSRLLFEACPEQELEHPFVGDLVSPSTASDRTITQPPSYRTVPTESEAPSIEPAESSRNVKFSDEEQQVSRVAAIDEHLYEIQETTVAVDDMCKRAFDELTARSLPPDLHVLKKRSELFKNPDFWQVSRGVFVDKSALGVPLNDFDYSAVFAPLREAGAKVRLRTVSKTEYVDPTTGERHDNVQLEDSSFSGWVLVNDQLKIFNSPGIVATMELSRERQHNYNIEVIEGVPGCGKSYEIINRCPADHSAVITCPVRESVEDTRKQFVAKYPGFNRPKLYVRTIDSYLTNWHTDGKTRSLKADVLFVDECYMTHSGKIFAMAAMLGVRQVYAYGDRQQIPHCPRANVPAIYVRLPASTLDFRWVNRRNPASAVAAWAHLYDHKVRALSTEEGEFREVRDTVGLEIPKDCVMMVMFQHDKNELRRLYSRHLKRIRIMTAHESEGKTFDHVWLHNFDVRRRNPGDKWLFDAEPYCLVAASRHRKQFLYVNKGTKETGGIISKWIEKSRDVKRLSAVRDVDSAGSSKEFA